MSEGISENAPAQMQTLRIAGASSDENIAIAYDACGVDGAPRVILLHGGGQTRHSWSTTARSLATQGYRVYNFDARGHGESDWSETGAYSLNDRVEDLEQIVALAQGPFVLVGASLGGATALCALAKGLRPAGVVLVDIVPEPEPEGIAKITGFMGAHPNGFADLSEAADAVAAYNPSRPRPSDPSGLMRNLRRREDGRLYWHWDPQIISDGARGHHSQVQAAAEIVARERPCPVALVRGLKSDVVSDEGVARFRALIRDLEVFDVGGAGHMVAGDNNDAFETAVLSFLGRHLQVQGD
ncbi:MULTISPECIES: alpha/beta fold hydrolase [Citromicrobium]|uniref:alpha/beta fold hydrolase n=1 Tax=Citromicrobium TaxID=72173 RepID=UPI0001DD057F|nr:MULTISPECIES: alpha/beta hydrolase [Citromicrobium]ALG60473.1 alpha/beta hydrolase [Citromicrobium sp. JL477]